LLFSAVVAFRLPEALAAERLRPAMPREAAG
jgi:hypothetical protein